MKKNLLKWMMAVAIAATPMIFTACGDDDDNNNGTNKSGDSQTTSYVYHISIIEEMTSVTDTQGYQQAKNIIRNGMTQAVFTAIGKQFDGTSTSISGVLADSTKIRLSCDAAYTQLKDTELYGGSLYVYIKVGTNIEDSETIASYGFNVKTTSYIDFEDATLNRSNYWIGDSVSGTKEEVDWGYFWKCTYTEGLATLHTTYGGTWWSGFAISACTGTTFADNYKGADQYNNITGKARSGNNFLVINGVTSEGNNITFSKPVTVVGFYYTNAAVTVNSILNGDRMEPNPFNENDWLKCIVTGTRKDGQTVTHELMLAENGDYTKTWKATRGMDETFTDIVKLEFSFDGTRKPNNSLNTPAYICIDRMMLY